ncbi:hypothetical protein [Pararhizobium sp. PWRC1-1]|uniref:hypothetical protein n=1 Tax=Pararhizobium sp. PWRC1-1 TaxID=2804566 RepID=UPI003CEA1F16
MALDAFTDMQSGITLSGGSSTNTVAAHALGEVRFVDNEQRGHLITQIEAVLARSTIPMSKTSSSGKATLSLRRPTPYAGAPEQAARRSQCAL